MNIRSSILFAYINQIFLLVLPFITAPYLARVLGPESLGQFAYTNTIANYFVVIAMLGIKTYSNRSLPQCSTSLERSNIFANIFCVQIFSTVLMLCAYIVYLWFSSGDTAIATIQMLLVVSCFFDLSWVLLALDKFKIFTQINIVIKLISVLAIFTSVKTAADIIIYSWIATLTILLTQIAIAFYVLKTLPWSKPDFKNISVTLKPILLLFLPIIATNIYKATDKIWLGNYSTMQTVAFYDNAKKVLGFPEGLFIALTMVMLPKISQLVVTNKHWLAKKYFSNSLDSSMLIACGSTWGIAAIAPEFAILYFGPEFAVCGQYIQLLAPILVFIAWSSIIRTNYLIPHRQDKIYVHSVVFGAAVNLLLNFVAIPRYAVFGAIASALSAEFFIAVYQSFKIKNYHKFKGNISNLVAFCCIGGLMFLLIRELLVPTLELAGYGYSLTVLACIILGMVFYLVVAALYLIYNKHPLYMLLLVQAKSLVSRARN